MCKQTSILKKKFKFLKKNDLQTRSTYSSTSNQIHPKVIKDTFRTYFLTITFD